MLTITAIHGGGDWADASVEYLILPDGMNIDDEAIAHKNWYKNIYCPARKSGEVEYVNLCEWLKRKGARTTTDDELYVFYDS